MRYIKVLLLVLIFFLSMIFLFQNQETLAKDMVLKLNLFFFPPFQPAPLPTYFILLAGFLLGALCAMALLFWDKLSLSAKLMKARWRVRDLEKEVAKLSAEKPAPAPVGGLKAKLALKKPEAPKNDISAPDPDKNV